jgi:hypothetical protein
MAHGLEADTTSSMGARSSAQQPDRWTLASRARCSGREKSGLFVTTV